MDFKKINWLGLAGGFTALALVILAVAHAAPWWRLTVGEELGEANISPLSYNITLLGSSVTSPIVWFLNLGAQLSFLACAIAMLIYSVVPDREFSRNLLNFAYKKPLIIIIVFVVGLFVITYAAGTLLNLAQASAGVNVPLAGSTTLTIRVADATVTIPMATGFTWTFWLAVASTGLCVAARFYHKKIVPS